MNEDDKKLNALIELASNTKLKDDGEHWYSHKNQKKLIYNLAIQLILTEDMKVEEAVKISASFHKHFYNKIMRVNT